MWLIALHWAQLQSGFHIPLLQDPMVPAPHLEGLYIMSLREFLASITGSIVTEHYYTIPLQRVHDRAIMDVVIASKAFTSSECKIIDFSFLALEPSLFSSASTLIELVTRATTNSLSTAIVATSKSITGGLHQPLGKWLVPAPQLRRRWPFYFDPDTKTLWSMNREGFCIHSPIQIGSNWRNTQILLQMNQHMAIIPSDSFPVECHETMAHHPCQTLQPFLQIFCCGNNPSLIK
jgi:hypothetical protein